MMLVMGLHIELDQLENEATPYFTLLATLESYLLFVQTSVSKTY